ncbi:MAG TPA: class III lanthionine synthetase LanKC [Streptosporangiaceae bacterium]|nr:class III lanthionine synthetase LanKC [Streptosporangiaceae bacterium]
MDKRYELFCLADPLFYDSPDASEASGPGFAAAARPLPDGWRRLCLGEWLVHVPPDEQIPAQGWKIHVSGCRENAEWLLGRVFDYCVPRAISFKFLRSPLALHIRNAKYAPRGSSGKLVAIYPADDSSCERILAELDRLIGGASGPYILSDLRYGGGPLYVRYGAFTEQHCRNAEGELVPAMTDASGELVPDLRQPFFSVPPWVALPAFLTPHLEARSAARTKELPHRVDEALHFSNGGGVYAGTDAVSGERVVLKEARPYAGLAADGSDAVTRLRRERDMLTLLSGLGVAPEARGYFEAGGHHFLVQDYIDGAPLNSFFAHRHPLLKAAPDSTEISAYTTWALGICDGVQRAVEAVHGRGVVVNDLHMFNIMVRPDDSVVLIDFEAAARADEGKRPVLGNPGFVAPRDRVGFGIDEYSLACLKLAIFLPLTTLFALDLGKAAHIAEVIAETFPVPAPFLDGALRDIAGSRPRTAAPRPGSRAFRSPSRPAAGFAIGPACWEPTRQSLTRAILASATGSRADRLFPGDIEQFSAPSGGLCIASGAAGVLYALSEAATPASAEHVEWLVTRTAEPVSGSRLGLFDGMFGVACVLDRLGCGDAARRVAGTYLTERWERLGTDLHSGLSGLALALLHLGDALGEPRLREAGQRAADIVADRIRAWPGGRPRGRAGLMRGCSGPALLFIRLFERTADSGYLDLAAEALGADLDRCVLNDRGALQVDEGWRLMPYLDAGSVGIGYVIDDYLAHRDDDKLRSAASAITLAACSMYYAQSGLFSGRAGMLLYLAHGPADVDDPRIAAHVRRLAWHAMSYRDGTAFPGDTLFRLSMDLATGTAGVLLALAAALSPAGAAMPFLGPSRPQADGRIGRHLEVPGRPAQGMDPGHPVPGPQ